MAQEFFEVSSSDLRSAQKKKIKIIQSKLNEKNIIWEDMPDVRDLPIPGLQEAIKLETKELVLPILDGNYGIALRRAIYGKKRSIIQTLLPHVKNIHSPSPSMKNQCALHIAARMGMSDVVKLLITHGAYINIVDADENTPLHIACQYKQIDTAHTLLELGAVSMKNTAKKFPDDLINDNSLCAKYYDTPLIEENINRKNALPPLSHTKYAWLDKSHGINCYFFLCKNESNESGAQKDKNPIALTEKHEFEKLLEILKKKYIVLSSKDIINLDTKLCREVLNAQITKMLWTDDSYHINTSLHTLKNTLPLVKKVMSLENNLDCKFGIHYRQIAKNDYFIKSKSRVSAELREKLSGIDASLYTIQQDELFIKDIHFEDFINATLKNTPCARPQ